jgi:conjugal transfer/entry exclusion protein
MEITNTRARTREGTNARNKKDYARLEENRFRTGGTSLGFRREGTRV